MNDSDPFTPAEGFVADLPASFRDVDMHVAFLYNATDPCYVHLHFPGKQGPLWSISRELLWIGLYRENGLRDVRVTPTPDGVKVLLSAPQKVEGKPDVWMAATVVFETWDLWAALNRTYQMCPAEEEYADRESAFDFLGGVA